VCPIFAWADAGRGARRDLSGLANAVLSLRSLPGGRLAFGSGDPAWGILDASGRFQQHHRAAIADLRNLGDGFRLAADGKTVRFSYEPLGTRPALFQISGRRLLLDPHADNALARPRTAPEIKGWKDTEKPTLRGKPLNLRPLEKSRCFAVAADDRSFLLGTDSHIYSFNSSGDELWETPSPDTAWAVQVTSDGRLAVAAFGDGTIRWYRYRDGHELLAFFPSADGRRWVLWTPSGYFDASLGGEDLIGWHFNHGLDHEADFFAAWHFRDQYRRPEVIDLILDTLDETAALRRVGITPALPQPLATSPIAASLPPVVTVLEPASGAAISTSPVQLRIDVRSVSGAPVTALRARVDGRPITSRGDAVYLPEAGAPSRSFYREIAVPEEIRFEEMDQRTGVADDPLHLACSLSLRAHSMSSSWCCSCSSRR
jgi:hypothetical protein